MMSAKSMFTIQPLLRTSGRAIGGNRPYRRFTRAENPARPRAGYKYKFELGGCKDAEFSGLVGPGGLALVATPLARDEAAWMLGPVLRRREDFGTQIPRLPARATMANFYSGSGDLARSCGAGPVGLALVAMPFAFDEAAWTRGPALL